MDFSTWQEQNKPALPPNLDNGMEFKSISKVSDTEFNTPQGPAQGMRVFTDKGEFKTSSKVIIETLHNYFAKNTEPMTNVRVVAPRGKRYLTLEKL